MSNLKPTKDTTQKILRVPLFKKDDIFMIWTGQHMVRRFTPDDLPDIIKIRLGIIMQSVYAAELNQQEMFNTDFEQERMKTGVYVSKFGPEYEDIGWQFNKYYYCIVMTDEELASLEKSAPQQPQQE